LACANYRSTANKSAHRAFDLIETAATLKAKIA
jgi:hypothetical protein